jgi:hypothetical protein
MYAMCRLVQAFNPQFAVSNVDAQWVDDLVGVKPLGALADISAMKAQLPTYLALAAAASFDMTDVTDFTEAILLWWRINAKVIPAWALAARIVFAISPNSASCERVFALLKHMFGDQQASTLSDYIQVALMLAYNMRKIG